MLKKILSIKGIGLFGNAPASPPLSKATLIYAENARGKSTLAEILRACKENQSATLAGRQTLDAAIPQEVGLLIEDANGSARQVNLQGGTWSQAITDIQVFDTDFITKNVYSGNEITVNQRANLLDFALDEQTVQLRVQLDALTGEITNATQQTTAAERVLNAHAIGMPIREYIALPLDPDIGQKIEQLNNRIGLSRNREALGRQPAPQLIAAPQLDLAALFGILRETIQDIEQRAEQTVQEHLARFRHPELERWISQGQDFQADQQCPYCGQDINGNELIRAYRTHFNQHYAELKQRVSRLTPGVEQRLSDAVLDGLITQVNNAREVAAAWEVPLQRPMQAIEFNQLQLNRNFIELRQQLMGLAERKSLQPLERVGTEEEFNQANAAWQAIRQGIADANVTITQTGNDVAAFKEQLNAENVDTLNRNLDALNRQRGRHTDQIIADVQAYQDAAAHKTQKVQRKEQIRAQLDALMTATLNTYQNEINRLLTIFGASFQIERINFDYRGTGKPRSQYVISMRGREIQQAPGNGPHFGNTLSDGDKRSLALAFFIARLKTDPQLAQKILVIDDPMCSFDANRRGATLRELKWLAANSKQVIILAHDSYFLRELRNELIATPIPTTDFAIARGANNYSEFGNIDLHALCESDYNKDHRLIAQYAEDPRGMDPRLVARAIRPLLEGYLHRRFPNLIPDKSLFGDVIAKIRQAAPPNPLTHLHHLIGELNEINAYAGQFHHNKNAQADQVQIADGELNTYCQRALQVIYKGSL